MKIVINTCYGGFGLSEEAFEKLLTRKGIEFEKVIAKSPIRGDNHDYYEKGHAGEDSHFLWYWDFTENRADPDLIAVIEELGEKANGWAAELKIVLVPDNVQWYIAEYDGMEHVAEEHRTWR